MEGWSFVSQPGSVSQSGCSAIKDEVGYLQKPWGSLPMGLHIRDDRQMKALTGLSQDQFDHLLRFFIAIYKTTQQQTYAAGVASGTRKRKPGGGSKGKLPTMAEKLQCVLYYYKTYRSEEP